MDKDETGHLLNAIEQNADRRERAIRTGNIAIGIICLLLLLILWRVW